MEPVFPYAVHLVPFVRHGIKVRPGMHGLVESSIEHGDVRDTRECFPGGFYSGNVGGHVQGPQVFKAFYVFQSFIVYKAGFVEDSPAVEHPVADGCDVLYILYRAFFFVGKEPEYPGQSRSMVCKACFYAQVGIPVVLVAQKPVACADALCYPLADYFFFGPVIELILYGGTAAVES